MSRLFLSALLAFALVTFAARRAEAGDPYVRWYTLETPHFNVHYHGGLEPVAQKAASVAEAVYERLVPELGFRPSVKTELVLSDEAEYANGFAWTIPYPTMRLLVSAPDDMSGLADYDDWLTGLVTHELTHILHISNVSGIPGAVNTVFGPTLSPNHDQPNWIIEGLAVAMETEHTTGGRLRSTQLEMMLRTDVLSDRLFRLDEFSHIPQRWPTSSVWYLYGSKFVEWIASIYGPDVFGAIATDYGAQVIPYGANRAVRRATGRTYEELFAGWKADLERRYAREKAALEAIGLREGRRLTHRGWDAATPRFLPAACGEGRRVAYVKSDGDELSGIYSVALDRGNERDERLLARTGGRSVAFGPDCALYFEGTVPTHRQYYFNDLFRLAKGERSPRGTEKNREALTRGARARDLDVSPDGRRIVYVTNDRGTTTLRIAELRDGGLANSRRLVPSASFEQAFTPRFSPDGTRVAYGAWTAGGYRDIRVVDVATGRFFELAHDRAIDQQPAWAPDGKTLYFTSDRTGIANVYAYDFASASLAQVTNVLSGAYMPVVSADGRTLVYVGYSSDGYDLYELALDRSRFLQAQPNAVERAKPAAIPVRSWPSRPYQPLRTLWPRSWGISLGTGTFGNAVTLTTSGSDAVQHHFFQARLVIETEEPALAGSVDYLYTGLPFAFQATLFRGTAPRNDYRVGETPETVIEQNFGVSSRLSFDVPAEYDYQNIQLWYTLAHWQHEEPLGDDLDPYAPLPYEPDSGLIGIVHLEYGFSNATRTNRAVSNESGFNLNLATDLANEAWGSESTLTAFSARFAGYLPMPWLRHHVLALGLSGGVSEGTYARYGLYSTGGFAVTAPFDTLTTSYPQSSFVLRGYEPAQFIGSNFNLLNLEYRFPILDLDVGLSTLPGFLRRLSGAAFLDWGGTYERLDEDRPLDPFHVGVGGELWLEFMLAYETLGSVRFGVARGLDSEAPPGLQTYFVAAAAF